MSVPESLERIIEQFHRAPAALRVALLHEFAGRLPDLPDEKVADASGFERVEECQSPLYVASEISGDRVQLWFDAPLEAPTTRGFAGVLHQGLHDCAVERFLAVPEKLSERLPLQGVVSPLRLRGLDAMLVRLKRQVRTSLRHD